MQSGPGLNYPGTQQSSQPRSRLRAASATLPLNLDLRNQYRSTSSTRRSPSHIGSGRSATSVSQYADPSIYTTSYPPAPLTAPMDFSPPRPSNAKPHGQEYSNAQTSAPITAPSDFSQALHGSVSNQTSRTPMRDSFGSGALGYNQSEERNDSFGDTLSGPASWKRDRSFTLPAGATGSMSGSESQTYGHTTSC